MPLTLERKKVIVAEISDAASHALSAVVAEYRGLTVAEMNELRMKAREMGVRVRVARNTLVRRAFENTDFACLHDALVGPLVLALSESDPGAAARLMRDFMKDHEKLEVKALAVNGELYTSAQLEAVASLPTRDEAIAMLMSVMKAPIGKFVRTLAEPHAKFVRTLAAVRDQKQQAA